MNLRRSTAACYHGVMLAVVGNVVVIYVALFAAHRRANLIPAPRAVGYTW